MRAKKEAPPARRNRRSKIDSTSVYHDLFSDVKKNTDMLEVVRFYGYTPNRGFICCPFHNEKTPSCKIYADGFHCFGCGESGSVIDFTAKLFNLDPIGACRRLNDDFRLCLPIDRPPTRAEQEAAKARRRVADARNLFHEWREAVLNEIDAAIRVANTADMENLTDAEALAVRHREHLEYIADILLHASLDEQMSIFRERKEVGRLCQMILSNSPMKSRTA